MDKPVLKKPHGSFYPKLPASYFASGLREVFDVNNQVLYIGRSEHVARLVFACMLPRII